MSLYTRLWAWHHYRRFYQMMGEYTAVIVACMFLITLYLQPVGTMLIAFTECILTTNGVQYIALFRYWYRHRYIRPTHILTTILNSNPPGQIGLNIRCGGTATDEYIHRFLCGNVSLADIYPEMDMSYQISPASEHMESNLYAAIREEFAFRILFKYICDALDINTATFILWSSIIFAAMHNIMHRVCAPKERRWSYYTHIRVFLYTYTGGIRFSLMYAVDPSISMAICLIVWHFILNECDVLSNQALAMLWTRHVAGFSKSRLARIRDEYIQHLRAHPGRGLYRKTRQFLLTRFLIPITYHRSPPI